MPQRLKSTVPQTLEVGQFSGGTIGRARSIFNVNFWILTEQELLDDTTVECHHVGTPHEPLNSLQEALAAGHSKDLRRHVDPALHEVILDNFHRPPHLRAQSRIVFLRKYTQQAQHFLLELNALRFGAIGSVAASSEYLLLSGGLEFLVWNCLHGLL